MTLAPERIAAIKVFLANCEAVSDETDPVSALIKTCRALIARIEELERDNAALEAQVEALKGEGGEPRTISIKAASLGAARRERERCAKTCDLAGYGPASGWTAEQAEWWETGVIDGSRMCADRIRALEDEA